MAQTATSSTYSTQLAGRDAREQDLINSLLQDARSSDRSPLDIVTTVRGYTPIETSYKPTATTSVADDPDVLPLSFLADSLETPALDDDDESARAASDEVDRYGDGPPGDRKRKRLSQHTEVAKQHRRESHKEVERRRRGTINDGIKVLTTLVPGCDAKKGSILQRTAEYIKELQHQIAIAHPMPAESHIVDGGGGGGDHSVSVRPAADAAVMSLLSERDEYRRLWAEAQQEIERLRQFQRVPVQKNIPVDAGDLHS